VLQQCGGGEGRYYFLQAFPSTLVSSLLDMTEESINLCHEEIPVTGTTFWIPSERTGHRGSIVPTVVNQRKFYLYTPVKHKFYEDWYVVRGTARRYTGRVGLDCDKRTKLSVGLAGEPSHGLPTTPTFLKVAELSPKRSVLCTPATPNDVCSDMLLDHGTARHSTPSQNSTFTSCTGHHGPHERILPIQAFIGHF
jgi:hypothetical protein